VRDKIGNLLFFLRSGHGDAASGGGRFRFGETVLDLTRARIFSSRLIVSYPPRRVLPRSRFSFSVLPSDSLIAVGGDVCCLCWAPENGCVTSSRLRGGKVPRLPLLNYRGSEISPCKFVFPLLKVSPASRRIPGRKRFSSFPPRGCRNLGFCDEIVSFPGEPLDRGGISGNSPLSF